MGKRERHALGAFFKGFGEEYTRRQAEGRAEQKQARAAWFRCIMEGGKEEDCLNISGYRPEEDEVHGALSERERQVGVERRAGLEEEGKEYREKHIPLTSPEIQELEIPRYRQDVSRTIFKPGQITTPVEREALGEAEIRRRGEVELKEKRTYEEGQAEKTLTRQEAKERRMARYRAGLKGEEEEKVSPRRKKWEATVDAIVRVNLILASQGKVFEVPEPTWEEYDAKFVEVANPKAQTKKLFNKMKGAGYDKDKMLEKYKENQASLMTDGVDLAYLLELIGAYE